MLRPLATVMQKTDHRRWSDLTNLEESWQPRTVRAAELVPKNSRVIEFGAGRRTLERHLDPSCSYTPSDIVDRGPGTIVLNLNEPPLPDLGADAYDVAVIMGVLEYLRDVPSVLDWLAGQVCTCVLSYCCTQGSRYSPRGVIERFYRLRAGWMNHYREDALRTLFSERGFDTLHTETMGNNRLFVFARPV
jgi:Methyltransferase domain